MLILFKKGHVIHENETKNHREYCLKVRQVNQSIILGAMICYDAPDEPHVRYSTLPYRMFVVKWRLMNQPNQWRDLWFFLVMMISAPLMVVTILVYVTIPELLNLCGKCIVCYLVSLTTFYISLSYVYLHAGSYISSTVCTMLAYTIYFAYLSTIIWLNVLSYDFWKHFR